MNLLTYNSHLEGAGKTTVAEKAVELNNVKLGEESKSSISCLDLDVCVPQWMKDNFSKGMYPTLEQRKEFAISACDYVDDQLGNGKMQQVLSVVISFSFVNTDLREIFRSRFPHAKWVLIDTSERDAQKRIDEREGHFYSGQTKRSDDENADTETPEPASNNEEDNSEWQFAPVDFGHLRLDGLRSVEDNARMVVQLLT